MPYIFLFVRRIISHQGSSFPCLESFGSACDNKASKHLCSSLSSMKAQDQIRPVDQDSKVSKLPPWCRETPSALLGWNCTPYTQRFTKPFILAASSASNGQRDKRSMQTFGRNAPMTLWRSRDPFSKLLQFAGRSAKRMARFEDSQDEGVMDADERERVEKLW